MANLFEKIRRTTNYHYYRKKNNWFFPSNTAHLTGGEMAKGNYEPKILNILDENLTRGDVFIDVGANVGYFARHASKLVQDTGQVYALEADPYNYFALYKNTAQLNNVTSLHIAVSNVHQLIDLHVSNHSSSHSILQTSKHLNGTKFSVPSTTLDKFWDSYLDRTEIKLVKIDVEGAEIFVLDGMEKMLEAKKVKAIILEIHPVIISKAGIDIQRLYSIFERYFVVWLVRDNSFKIVRLQSCEHFKKIMNEVLKKGKDGKLNLFCKRFDRQA